MVVLVEEVVLVAVVLVAEIVLVALVVVLVAVVVLIIPSQNDSLHAPGTLIRHYILPGGVGQAHVHSDI